MPAMTVMPGGRPGFALSHARKSGSGNVAPTKMVEEGRCAVGCVGQVFRIMRRRAGIVDELRQLTGQLAGADHRDSDHDGDDDRNYHDGQPRPSRIPAAPRVAVNGNTALRSRRLQPPAAAAAAAMVATVAAYRRARRPRRRRHRRRRSQPSQRPLRHCCAARENCAEFKNS